MNMGENVKVEAEDGQQEQQIGAEEKYDIVSDLDTSGDIQEVVLDKNGRIPGGILPSSPCHVDMNYAFRSIPSFLDTSNPVCLCVHDLALSAPDSEKIGFGCF